MKKDESAATTDVDNIHESAVFFKKEVEKLEERLSGLKKDLATIQSCCDHPDMERYRGKYIGSCVRCLYQGFSRTEIDMIFAD